MTYSIRANLLAVALLGVATCALALYSLAKPLAMASEHRQARVRDAVAQEVQRLRTTSELVEAGSQGRTFGLRSGQLAADETLGGMSPPLEPEVIAVLHEALLMATTEQTKVSIERNVPTGTVFAAAMPTTNGKMAWAAHLLGPAQWTPVLRIVGGLIVATSIGLVFASLYMVASVRRGARSLLGSLAMLGKDLSATVPIPQVRELADVGGGIARLARELSQAQVALAERERLAVLGRVTAGVAHEIRNPLAAIKLRVDLALKAPDLGGELRSDLSNVGEEVARLDRLLHDLLTLAGKRIGQRGEIELGAFARRRVELLAPFADEHGVRMKVDGSATTHADGDALARALDNLLRNAIEASPPGEVIRIQAERRSERSLLRILDRGEGIPSDRRHELFEPFFTTKPEGVGLGLALSRAIVEAHGGTLTYEREAEASVFELSLPTEESPGQP
jgi:signal transduction histidine kinase